MKPPEDLDLSDPKHRGTIDYTKHLRIYSLWLLDEAATRVLKEIVGHSQLMHIINVLLMGRLPLDVICQKVALKFRLVEEVTPSMLEVYRHYFWNFDAAGYREWEQMLAGDPYRDRYLSSLYCGEDQALFRAGFTPKVDNLAAIREAFRQVYFRLEALRGQDDEASVSRLARLSREARALYGVLQDNGSGLNEQMKELKRFLMLNRVPTLAEIAAIVNKDIGGSHSGDSQGSYVIPMKELEDDNERDEDTGMGPYLT
jgi:hypothetical protein